MFLNSTQTPIGDGDALTRYLHKVSMLIASNASNMQQALVNGRLLPNFAVLLYQQQV
jgi:hypothetical protein